MSSVPKVPGGRRQADLGLRRERIVGRQHVGEDRHEHDHHDEPRRRRAERFAPQRGGERAAAADDDRRLLDAHDPLGDRRHQL
jgi:hypothetical protein